jgi:hypothetical protein
MAALATVELAAGSALAAALAIKCRDKCDTV